MRWWQSTGLVFLLGSFCSGSALASYSDWQLFREFVEEWVTVSWQKHPLVTLLPAVGYQLSANEKEQIEREVEALALDIGALQNSHARTIYFRAIPREEVYVNATGIPWTDNNLIALGKLVESSALEKSFTTTVRHIRIAKLAGDSRELKVTFFTPSPSPEEIKQELLHNTHPSDRRRPVRRMGHKPPRYNKKYNGVRHGARRGDIQQPRKHN